MTANRLEVRNLRVSYGDTAALSGATFTCGEGEIVGVIGPNGAGKSTLIKAILGLVKREHGEVNFGGVPVARRRCEIAYMPQRSDVDWNYPAVVEQVVAMGRYPHGRLWRRANRHDRALVAEALERVGLGAFAAAPIGELSGGQQQRVFLARALAQQARLLLLDEPFAAIDAVTRAVLWEQLHELRREGRGILLVHHELMGAGGNFTKLLILSHTMVAFGAPSEVLTRDNLQIAYGEADGTVQRTVKTAAPSAEAEAPMLKVVHRGAKPPP